MKRGDNAVDFAHKKQSVYLRELIAVSTKPSISTDPDYKKDILDAVDWVAKKLSRLGMEDVTIHPTGGHPQVYAESVKACCCAPTVLIYGHYNLQPAEPLNKWESEPFEPEVHGDNIYARGTINNPAQALAEFIAGMHDFNGRINLPGFYDSVKSLSAEDRSDLANFLKNETWYLENTGAPALWGEPAALKQEGGSIPVVSQLQHILGVETLNTGFELPSDNMHGPNEKLHLPTWFKGIDSLFHFCFNLVEK